MGVRAAPAIMGRLGRLRGLGGLGSLGQTGRSNIPPAPFKGGDVTGKHTRKI
ncbi:hypothetical protein [Capnocytophaga leadbetteri]|uniref:hypothetical protein n=1 Tax=Capnocytophaga leadbetteri TaxID=327575 RepID=UPI0028EDDE83|nr:hypothetical protein [Capnocytophaga leadbetteri]